MDEHGKFLGSWKDEVFVLYVAFAVASCLMSGEGVETVA